MRVYKTRIDDRMVRFYTVRSAKCDSAEKWKDLKCEMFCKYYCILTAALPHCCIIE